MNKEDSASVYLIDASIYVFRAWFSVPDAIRGEDDMPVNAVYGFCRFLTEFVERSNARYVGVAFDESLTRSFRNELYPQYKMNRELPPAELESQFKLCWQLADAAGLHCIAHERYEADDLIASMAMEMRGHGFRNIIVSSDKDLAQCLRGDDIWWDFARNQELQSEHVLEKFGVKPAAIQDYLGLCGDAVDNIPGVPGVGPKTAAALLQAFDSLEAIYENLAEVPHLKIRGAKTLAAKLSAHKEMAILSKTLATVVYDAPIVKGAEALRRRSADSDSLQKIGQKMGGRGAGLFQRLIASANTAHER